MRDRGTLHAALAIAAACLLASALTPATSSSAAPSSASDPALASLRSARRAQVRAATAAAQARQMLATIPVLVVPVDFADARLPGGWDSARELAAPLETGVPGGRGLGDYFDVASAGRARMTFTVAPLVHLSGTRRDYSDVDLNGFTRTRRLAAEALTAARDQGRIAFRYLDDDGPDGIAGSADDDGEVDAVLILHNDTGDENDPNALIQALQYYLATPVVDRGVVARSYAVASLRSGVGIWAHESAHLLGLEDRYDPFLPSGAGDLAGRGGLGIFSLMAAGAYGTGAGEGASLLDAYSAEQLGWCDVVPQRGAGFATVTLASVVDRGQAWRVWTHGEQDAESFLMEVRRGAAAGPWDAALPAGQLVVYHLDTSLPELAQSSSNPLTRHLRVGLLEADGDGSLLAGLDHGGPSDLFPGADGVSALTPLTTPSSAGYTGPTEVWLTSIASVGGAISCVLADATTPGFTLAFGFAGASQDTLALKAVPTGIPVGALAADVVVVSDPAWGSFAGADSVRVVLERRSDGSWTPSSLLLWTVAAGVPAGALTRFRVRLDDGDGFTQSFAREWAWRDQPLAFTGAWPDGWTTLDRAPTHPGTAWHRWAGPGVPTADGSAVLICTGAADTSTASWPNVSYANGADLALISPPLPAGTSAVRLVHAIDGELQRPGVAWDGGVVEFLAGDGTWLPAEPIDGYGGIVAPESRAGLHGRPAFAGEDSMTATGPELWRVDVLPIPAGAARPLRVALRFAADLQFRGRGWLVARLAESAIPIQDRAFPVAWVPAAGATDGRGSFAWDWPGETASTFRVEVSPDAGASWTSIYAGTPLGGLAHYPYAVPFSPAAFPLASGPGRGAKAAWPPLVSDERLLVRVIAVTGLGDIVSRAVAFYPDAVIAAQQALGLPHPNPSRGDVSLTAALLADGRLDLYDLRGRQLRTWRLPRGEQTVTWDGRDERGRRVPSGVYLFVLPAAEGSGAITRKVVLVR